MEAYFAMRTEDKYKAGGLVSAQAYYNQVFSMPIYQPFQAGTNAILVADGYGDVIPAQ
jgi:hypothetical protein